ncbi:hypothetical protein FWH58_00150 [Candidatus Saccharibacteria bacterium]|nr:hypothetical protein [Candidatus Saccharibacteria bacterium]
MMNDGLDSAGKHGSEISDDVKKYLVRRYLPTIGIECHVQLAIYKKSLKELGAI